MDIGLPINSGSLSNLSKALGKYRCFLCCFFVYHYVDAEAKTHCFSYSIGCVVDTIPDYLPLVLRTRVTVSEWPKDQVPVFPPQFNKSVIAHSPHQSRIADKSSDVPLISIGPLGSLVFRNRPSDDAILAMINSSQKVCFLIICYWTQSSISYSFH